MRALKVGDFVKHKENDRIIFQVVQLLESVDENKPPMVNCIRVTDMHSYLGSDLQKYELTDDDI